MPQPFPRTQCGHHVPGGFSSAVTAISLQQSVQVPHRRPGAGCACPDVRCGQTSRQGSNSVSSRAGQRILVTSMVSPVTMALRSSCIISSCAEHSHIDVAIGQDHDTALADSHIDESNGASRREAELPPIASDVS